MFGTFEPEDEKEPVAYGLVHPIQSYNPFYLQFHHMFALFRNVFSANGWINKLSFILKGPGWTPGKPRLGDPQDIPLVSIWF
jgi:alkylglycerol monooxygenase